MSKKEKKQYFDAREYVNQQLAIRTDEALHERNKQFALDHAKDTNEQLIAYVQQCAEDLGHTPHMTEVIGGPYIMFRFDGWAKMLQEAGLPTNVRNPSHGGRKIYVDELKKQAKRWKAERAVAKSEYTAAKEIKTAQNNEEKALRKERDMLWGEEHQADTDEQLLDHVEAVAAECGHTPKKSEVMGAEYICKRIGSWALVCTLAELPLPKELKPPKKKEILQYENSRKQTIHSA